MSPHDTQDVAAALDGALTPASVTTANLGRRSQQ